MEQRYEVSLTEGEVKFIYALMATVAPNNELPNMNNMLFSIDGKLVDTGVIDVDKVDYDALVLNHEGWEVNNIDWYLQFKKDL